ncbi:MAG: hypothetical protein PHH22_04425 [Clostridia bacterium]|nr:hypothetical protein [Clostridia bacterium]
MSEPDKYLAALAIATGESIQNEINKILEDLNKSLTTEHYHIYFDTLLKFANNSNYIAIKMLLMATAMSKYSIDLSPVSNLTEFNFAFYASRIPKFNKEI